MSIIENFNMVDISKSGEDVVKLNLDSNIGELVAGANGRGFEWETYLKTNMPLVDWLSKTSLSARTKALVGNVDFGNANITKNTSTGKYEVNVPKDLLSALENTSEEESCCYAPFDFQAQETKVPLNLICVNSSTDIEDKLVADVVALGNDVDGIASKSAKVSEARKKVAELTLQFFMGLNLIQGTTQNTTPVLKKFHGLMEVMNNSKVKKITAGTNLLDTMKEVACRLSMFVGTKYVAWVNPAGLQTLQDEVVVPGQYYDSLPLGWTKDANGNIAYKGIRFESDPWVPCDLSTGKFEIWFLPEEHVGTIRFSNLLASDKMARSFSSQVTKAQGCILDGTSYFDFGATIYNNPAKIVKVGGCSLSSACVDGLDGLDALVNPITIAPKLA